MTRRSHGRGGKQLSFGSRSSKVPKELPREERAEVAQVEEVFSDSDDWLLSDDETEAAKVKKFFSDSETEYSLYPEDEYLDHLPSYGQIEPSQDITEKEGKNEVEESSTEKEIKNEPTKSKKKKRRKKQKVKDKAKAQAAIPELKEIKETSSSDLLEEKESPLEKVEEGIKETSSPDLLKEKESPLEKVEEEIKATEESMEVIQEPSPEEKDSENPKESTPEKPISDNKQESSPKTKNRVIRGLPLETETRAIKLELEERGFHPRKVVQMLAKTGKPLPLFLVSFPGEEPTRDLRTLQEKDIKIEPYRGRRGPPQCFCCQGFGHKQDSCKLPPRCMKCGGDHRTYSCTKDRSLPPKCANCGQGHTANYRGCRKFVKTQEKTCSQAAKTPFEEDLSPDLQAAITSLGQSDIMSIVNFIAKLLSRRMKRRS